MKRPWTIIGMLLAGMTPACAQESETPAAPAATQAAEAVAPPVVGQVPAQTGVAITTFAEGLEHPWGLAFLPDGRALVTERAGRLRFVGKDGRLSAPIAGVPAVFAEGQGGLLDVALDPEFQQNQFVYLSYAKGTPDNNGTAVARGRLVGNKLLDVVDIVDNPTRKAGDQHFGSRFAWMPDGTLLVAVGDGGNPPVRIGDELARFQAQNDHTLNGAVMRIDRDGKPAAGNPDFGGGEARLWTLGHRNIQGLAIDPETGAVWATEHGSRGGDEVNLLKSGGNYGWPRVSYSQEYTSPAYVSDLRTLEDHVDPVSVWTPSIAASGLAVYRGALFSGWDGNLLAGGLVSKDVRRIVLGPDGRPEQETAITIGERVRDVRVGPEGAVYVLTDAERGRILRLTPKE